MANKTKELEMRNSRKTIGVWIAMIVVAGGLVAYFRRKDWL